jgi:hypothetical protein
MGDVKSNNAAPSKVPWLGHLLNSNIIIKFINRIQKYSVLRTIVHDLPAFRHLRPSFLLILYLRTLLMVDLRRFKGFSLHEHLAKPLHPLTRLLQVPRPTEHQSSFANPLNRELQSTNAAPESLHLAVHRLDVAWSNDVQLWRFQFTFIGGFLQAFSAL